MKIEELTERLARLEAHVGIPEDDFLAPGKALKAMGIGKSETWLKRILERALAANKSGLECSLQEGEHFTHIEGSWLVNWPATKQVLLLGSQMVLPALPTKYGDVA